MSLGRIRSDGDVLEDHAILLYRRRGRYEYAAQTVRSVKRFYLTAHGYGAVEGALDLFDAGKQKQLSDPAFGGVILVEQLPMLCRKVGKQNIVYEFGQFCDFCHNIFLLISIFTS